jgi:hypothetical protein
MPILIATLLALHAGCGEGEVPASAVADHEISISEVPFRVLAGCGAFEPHPHPVYVHAAAVGDALDIRFFPRLEAPRVFAWARRHGLEVFEFVTAFPIRADGGGGGINYNFDGAGLAGLSETEITAEYCREISDLVGSSLASANLSVVDGIFARGPPGALDLGRRDRLIG